MQALNAGSISELGLDVQHSALSVTHGFHGLHFVLVPQVCSCVEGFDLSTQSHQMGMRIDLGAGFSVGYNLQWQPLPSAFCLYLADVTSHMPVNLGTFAVGGKSC